MTQKLAVGLIFYKKVSAAWVMNWLSVDKSCVAETGAVNFGTVIVALNTLVQGALTQPGWDRLVIVEDDMIMPLDALNRISACHTPEQAIVGSVYFSHRPPHEVIAYIKHEDRHWPLSPQTVEEWCAKPGLYQVDAVGGGFFSVARHVLEQWDASVPMFAINDRLLTQDLWFCHEAKKQGHQIFLDTGIVCDHLTEVPIGMADNRKYADTNTVVDFVFKETEPVPT